MSELKYKVGSISGPFKIIDNDERPHVETHYKLSIDGTNQTPWITKEICESIFDHYAKSELLEKKAESQRKTIAYWKDKFISRAEFWNQSTLENRTLKESNVELRGANESLTKQLTIMTENYNNAETDIMNLSHELKTVKGHLDLRIKGIEALEADAKKNRTEIALLKSDFETKNSELEILEEDYNFLKDVQKFTKVLGWIGWIGFFIALFGLIFFKG
jgi:chromosome segregation ATPase